MSDYLKPGDRVLDLRAVCRSGGMLAGLIAAPLAAGLSGWRLVPCVLVAAGAAVAGFVMAAIIARMALPAPRGQTVAARVGSAALGVALWASLAGGLLIAVACAVAAFLNAGGTSAAVTLLVGVGVSIVVGCLAALLERSGRTSPARRPRRNRGFLGLYRVTGRRDR